MGRKEILNWWWFLFIAGIVIPVVNVLFADSPFVYMFFHKLFITGLNPYLGDVLSFFVILMICIVFKLLSRIPFSIAIIRFLYILAGLVVLYLFFGFLIPQHVEIPKSPSRSYVDYHSTVKFTEYSWLHYMIYIITAALTFILFFMVNFPKPTKKI